MTGSSRLIIGKVLLLAAVVLVAPVTMPQAKAQEAGGNAVALTLQQAQDYALEHNRTIANASIDIQKAEASRWQNIASMLPQVSASADYSNYFGYMIDFGAMQLAMPPFVSMGITTSVALTGGQIVSVGIANLSRKMSDITLLKTEQEICDQVKQLYYSALVMQKTLDLLQESRDSMQKLYEFSQKSVDVGVSEQTAADQLLVQVITMDDNITSTRRSLEMVYNSMRLLLDIDVESDIVLLEGLDRLVDRDSMADVLNVPFNVEDNYSFRLLKASTELSRKQIALTGWSAGPSLSVYHQYTGKYYFSDESRMDMTPPNMLGVSLKVPIFTSLKTTKAIESAKYNYKQQLNTLENTELSLKVQYRQLAYNLSSALERYDTQSKNVEVAQRVFDNTARKYEHGVASSLDVTNAGTTLISAQSSYVQALLEIVNARISLEQLLNRQ